MPQVKYKNLFNPSSDEPFKLSRTKIELFIECERCFYLDRKIGISRPPSLPFTLNSAVDALLKKEFDIHRARGSRHPLMETYGIDAVPFRHEMMNEWRENFKGAQHFYRPANFVITGAVDDVWESKSGEIIIVDYKSTATKSEISLDSEYKEGFKRQMEIYQWIFRKNGFNVSKTGYFVYANGDKDKEAFDGKLEFNVQIIPYVGDDSWIEPILFKIEKCLKSDEMPKISDKCQYCSYRISAQDYERKIGF